MIKHYYRLCFTQLAPLRIGTGFGTETDSDVMKDGRGLPFIPGTALAGVLRCEFDKETAAGLFGDMKPNGKITESKILVSDAVLPRGAIVRVSMRDGVGLNDRKTNKKGAKYDFEVAETDSQYTAILELNDEAYAPALCEVLRRWISFGASFGARTTRGYGKMSVSVADRCFDLDSQLDTWLGFDPFEEKAFEGCEEWQAGDFSAESGSIVIEAGLSNIGNFVVRMNSSALQDNEEEAVPDNIPVMNIKGEPVVPGTSWAGAFRHHMRNISVSIGKEDILKSIDGLFGDTDHRSRIAFTETAFSDAKLKNLTRNAIDRFTSAPKKQGLYTVQVAYGGAGSLAITLPSDTDETLLSILSVALYDLDCGLLTFGGENGVGRGAAKLTSLSVNGEDRLGMLRAGETNKLLREVQNG